jgi:hypothetical protein
MQFETSRRSVETDPVQMQCQTWTDQRSPTAAEMHSTHQVCNNDVVRKQPGDDAKVAQCRNQKSRQEVECCGSQENVKEELEARNSPAVGGFVLVLVQAREHGGGYKSRGPYHAAWPDQKGPGQACYSIAENLSRQSEQDLVYNSQALVIELLLLNNYLAGKVLAKFYQRCGFSRGTNISSKGKAEGDVASNVHTAMLLGIPPSLTQPGFGILPAGPGL